MATTLLIIILIGRGIAASTSQPRLPGVDGSPARSLGVDGSPARSPGVGRSPAGRRERSISSPLETILLYNMTNFPGHVEAACVSGQKDRQITAGIVPHYYTNPTIKDSGREKHVSWASGAPAAGLVCYNTHDRRYRVMAPFIDHRAPLVPDRLSFTLGKDEDLHLTFTTRNPQEQVMWQKEPIITNRWQKATLDHHGQLIIPAGQLSGSGLYSVAPYTSAPSPDVKRSEIGTFSLLVRRCPDHQFGSRCSGWCPDCMNGGVCDEVSGQCVCPPGLSGRLCHTRCRTHVIGQNCSLLLHAYRGLQVCLAAPYGCHCLPGTQGLRCDTDCDAGLWGADCSQTCDHCWGNCHHVTGDCYHEPAQCAGGDMGLPRLRTPPRITSIKEDSAEVIFREWDSSFDDGQLTQGATLSHILRLLVDGREERRESVTSPSVRLVGLQPGTMYEVQVLLRVWLGGVWCEADGSGRERVHTAHFNTTCPKEPPVPSGIRISEVTSNSFLVKWQTLVEDCHLDFLVGVKEDPSKSKHVSGTELLVSGLKPFNTYSIVLWTYDQSARKHSNATADFTIRTLPGKPGPPVVTHTLQDKGVIFRWQASSTDQGNFTYRYTLSRTYQACDTSSPSSSGWTELSTDTIAHFRAAPYTTLHLRVQTVNEGGKGDITKHSVDVPPDVPGNKIRHALCSAEDNYCRVDMETNCRLEHGPGLRLDYLLLPLHDNILQYDYKRDDSSTRTLATPSRFSITLPNELLPYTEYKVIMFPANDAGRNHSLEHSEVITTAPAAPGRVARVRLEEEEPTSMTVKWDAPDDQPPTGRLENYKIYWRKKTGGTWKTTIVHSYSKSYTINNLTLNTEYTVKVSAKNAGVSDWGPPVEESATTKEGKPSVPRALRVVNVTQGEAVVQWQEPQRTYLPIINFTISARAIESRENQLPTTHNTTAMITPITGLKAGQQYLAKVAACNKKLCGHEAELLMWTKPAPPKPLTEVEWQDDSELTIKLPVVTTFPVWQWIIVADAQELLTKDIAKAIAVSEAPQDHSTNLSVWVAASLHQDGKNTTNVFVVGDNKTYGSFHNRPLEHDRGYKLTVVTESRAGPHKEFYVSEPRTIPESHAVPRGVLLACLLSLILLGILLAVIFWWRRKRHKPGPAEASPEMTVHFNNCLEESGTAPGGTQNAEAAVVPKDSTEVEGVHCPETDHKGKLPLVAAAESEYANMTRHVPRAQVEAFLARAIYSPDNEEEFKSVPAIMAKSCSDGERQENRLKNRYKNNLPYNETRVKLASLPDQPFSDYINANYIQGHSCPNAFIATQGPKEYNVDTIGDFWRMIWESNSHIIVMLTNLIENGRVKVSQYWPEEEPLLKDDIQVTFVSNDVEMDFIIRTLQVSKNGEVRSVKQYHYTAWPDHGVPQNPFGLTQMLNLLMEGYTTGPITVHCSAGIGRTGSIILTLFVLDQLNTSGYIDVLQALITLRNGRARLVENMTQYVFSHKLLQEILTGTKTSYLCGAFPEEVARLRLHQPHTDASLIHQQFKKLKKLPKDLTYKLAKDPDCAKLNRNPDIVPADNKMVFLQSLGGGLEYQYINVVRVSSMEHKDAYLAGEHPQGHTLGNMWWLVYEKRVPVWVLLHSFPDGHPEFPDVVPGEQPLVVSGLSLTLKDEFSFKNFVEYHVEITAPTSRVTAPHMCVILKMEGWLHTAPLPATPEPLLAVIDKAKYIAARKGCMLFTCKDGVEGCGLAMAMLQVEDRINLLQEVDIYRSVLSVIYDRPQFISSIEQYDFLHTAALDYLNTNQHYSNFV